MSRLLLLLYKYAPSKLKGVLLHKITQREGGQMYSKTLRAVFKEKYRIEIGYGSYGGCFNPENNIPPDVSFGNWCSIAKSIRIFRANHPKNTFTSHPLMYNPVAGYVKNDTLDRPPLKIGHDVWIGEWAIILPGVKTIGNGAMIGAGSIVTKDIEPYSVNVGNPAKKIGMRFDEETIARLEASGWWLLEKQELISRIPELNALLTGQDHPVKQHLVHQNE